MKTTGSDRSGPEVVLTAVASAAVSLFDLIFGTFCDLESKKCIGDIRGNLEGIAAVLYVVGVFVAAAAFVPAGVAAVALIGLLGLEMLWISLIVSFIMDLIVNITVSSRQSTGTCK